MSAALRLRGKPGQAEVANLDGGGMERSGREEGREEGRGSGGPYGGRGGVQWQVR